MIHRFLGIRRATCRPGDHQYFLSRGWEGITEPPRGSYPRPERQRARRQGAAFRNSTDKLGKGCASGRATQDSALCPVRLESKARSKRCHFRKNSSTASPFPFSFLVSSRV